MTSRISKLAKKWREILLFVLIGIILIPLPGYTLVVQAPSKNFVEKTIVQQCPAAQKDECLAAADLLEAVGSFYEVVIATLVALLAVIASLVYLSIRASARRQIEEQFQKDFDSQWIQESLKSRISEVAGVALSEQARKIELLEAALRRLTPSDLSEQEIAETTVVSPASKSKSKPKAVGAATKKAAASSRSKSGAR